MVDMETPPSIANDAADNTISPRHLDENPEDASSINPGYYFLVISISSTWISRKEKRGNLCLVMNYFFFFDLQRKQTKLLD
jgi:hypothetical protein